MMGIFSQAGETNNAGLGDRYPDLVKESAWNYNWFYDSEEAVDNGKPEPYGHNCQKIYYYMTYPIETCISMEREGTLGNTESEKRQKIKDILDSGAKRTNEKMIGKRSPEEDKKRNSIAFLAAIFFFLVFSVSLYKVWNIFTPKTKVVQNSNLQHRSYFGAWMMIIPALGLIILWKYVPMLMGSVMSFQDYQIVGDSQFIGLQNFADVLFDHEATGNAKYFLGTYFAWIGRWLLHLSFKGFL